MRFIPTSIHGLADYLIGALLIAAPWVLGFADGGAETWVPVLLGAGAIVYSLITDYELGMVHLIPMNTHLVLDIASGVLLAASPWLFGFDDLIWEPHLLVGVIEIAAGLFTVRTRQDRAQMGVPASSAY